MQMLSCIVRIDHVSENRSCLHPKEKYQEEPSSKLRCTAVQSTGTNMLDWTGLRRLNLTAQTLGLSIKC